MTDHNIIVSYSDEDGCDVAEIPDLEGCSALGSTPEQAVSELMMAKTAWLESAGEAGRRIPEPTPRRLIGM